MIRNCAMKKDLKYFKTLEIVNRKRQIEIDIVKGLAIFFMILVHTSNNYLDESYTDSIFSIVIDFMGKVPAAPVFMFAMGIGFIFSRNQNPARLFKRGVIIFFSGYLLNFLRGFFPIFIGSRLGYYSLTFDGGPWYKYLVEVDILHFAGLAMMFFAFLKLMKVNELFYPIIALVLGIISPFLWGISVGIPIFDVFLSTLFGGLEYSYHPFFSWIFYPLIGAFFGWMLIRTKNKNLF